MLNWSFLPPKEPLLAVGSNLVKSAADLVIEGRVVNSLRPTLVSAPVLSLLKTLLEVFPWITTASSCSESGTKLSETLSAWPRLRNTSVKVWSL